MGQTEPLESQEKTVTAGDDSNGASMEDILASIRRIIASEGAEEAPRAEEPVITEAGPATSGSPKPSTQNGSATESVEKSPRLSLASLAASVSGSKKNDIEPNVLRSLDSRETDARPVRQKPSANNIEEATGTAAGTTERPVAQTPSSTPGGLASLVARMSDETSASGAQSVPHKPAVEMPSGGSSAGLSDRPFDGIDVKSPTPESANEDRKKVSLSEIAAMASEQTETPKEPGASAKTQLQSDPQSGPSYREIAARAAQLANTDPENSATSALEIEKTSKQEDIADVDSPAPEKMKTSVDAQAGKARELPKSDQVSQFKEALVAPSTQAAVAGSMERLKKASADVNAAQVEAVLRPMLKEWLDDNLPSLVERLVSEEIAKIGNKIGNRDVA